MSYNHRKYYNLRFPKNGRFPTYLDMMSLYPFLGGTPDVWYDSVNLSDVDFLDNIDISDTVVSIEGNQDRIIVNIMDAPDEDQIYYYESGTARDADPTSSVIYGATRAADYGIFNTYMNNSLLGTKIRPTNTPISGTSTIPYGSVTVNGKIKDCIDFALPVTNTTEYNKIDILAQGNDGKRKRSVSYYGPEASTGLYANRCFTTLMNPYDYSDVDPNSANTISYDILTHPLLAEKTLVDQMFIESPNTQYSLSVSPNKVSVSGPKEITPQKVTVSGSMDVTIGSVSATKKLSKEYRLSYTLYNSDDMEIAHMSKRMSDDGTCVIDIVEMFPQVISFLDYECHIIGELYYMDKLLENAGTVRIDMEIVAEYDSYRIEAVNENNVLLNELVATTAAYVLPIPLYFRVYGSNQYITDRPVYDSSITLYARPVFKSGTQSQERAITQINGTRYVIPHLASFYSTRIPNWFAVEKVDFYVFKAGKGVLGNLTLPVADGSNIKNYFISSDIDKVSIYDRNTLSLNSLNITLNGNLESNSTRPVTSVQHEINIYVYNVNGEVVGNSIYNKPFETSTLSFDMYADFIDTSVVWNWFEIDRIEVIMSGDNIQANKGKITIQFNPEPTEDVYIDTDMDTDVNECIVMSDSEISPDTITVSYGIYLEDVYYPPTVGEYFMNFVLYNAVDSEIVTQTKIELDDTKEDNVTVVLTELFRNINWMNIGNLCIYISNEGLTPAGKYTEIYIPFVKNDDNNLPENTESEDNNE